MGRRPRFVLPPPLILSLLLQLLNPTLLHLSYQSFVCLRLLQLRPVHYFQAFIVAAVATEESPLSSS